MPRAARRDELSTQQRGFLDPRSFISRDGREFLAGEDMSVRRHEVWLRCDGFCERMGCNRCIITEETMHTHHVKHRSKGGAENLNSLEALCGRCHKREHAGREPQWSGTHETLGDA